MVGPAVRATPPKLLGPFSVGPRRVGATGKGEPIVYLGKDFAWAVGRKVMLQLVVVEE